MIIKCLCSFFFLIKRNKNQGKINALHRAAPAPSYFATPCPPRRVPEGCSLASCNILTKYSLFVFKIATLY